MKVSQKLGQEFEEFVTLAYYISADVGDKVEKMLEEGKVHPLTQAEAKQLLTKIVSVLKTEIDKNGSATERQMLEADVSQIVERIVNSRGTETSEQPQNSNGRRTVTLEKYNGITPGAVLPRPWFHGREVMMESGYVKTNNIQLWESNDRLDIHIAQFRQTHGRKPTSDELLAIMLSKMHMPGVAEEDQFEIEELANSIAVNGVRRPPIIDIDSTLLDGNRRVAACYYILNSDKFTTEQKLRVEYLFVWQLTLHAVNDDRNAVVVSLNFENDCKQPWPEYVRARKVYDEWQSMLAVEPRTPGPERVRQMRRELSQRFALGTDASRVSRYLKMVDWANEFEESLTAQGKDVYEVKHRANEYFQYFEELSKGTGPGGVAHTLNQDENYKHLVFELLFEGKFKNWTLLRKLKHSDQDVREALMRAREEKDVEEARDLIEHVLTDASNRKREVRVSSANTRIETFVKWLEDLPLSSFRREIRPENLKKLLDALRLVELQAQAVLGKKS